jgi:hypothetical protein
VPPLARNRIALRLRSNDRACLVIPGADPATLARLIRLAWQEVKQLAMSTATRRRPLPALAFLLALSVLTGIVWWRVLHRPEPAGSAGTPAVSQRATCTPAVNAIRLPTPASVTVVVLNGSGRDQLATKVSGQLKSRGFKTGTPLTAPTPLSGVGEIQYGTAGRAGATLLGYHLPGAKLTPVSRAGARINLVLGSGFRSLAPADSVKRAVASASKPC